MLSNSFRRSKGRIGYDTHDSILAAVFTVSPNSWKRDRSPRRRPAVTGPCRYGEKKKWPTLSRKYPQDSTYRVQTEAHTQFTCVGPLCSNALALHLLGASVRKTKERTYQANLCAKCVSYAWVGSLYAKYKQVDLPRSRVTSLILTLQSQANLAMTTA